MSRLEKTLSKKKNVNAFWIKFGFSFFLILTFAISIATIDSRVAVFIGAENNNLIKKICIFAKGLSLKIR